MLVMQQDFYDVLRPQVSARHTFTAAQRNRIIYELECLAIILALKKFNMHRDGARFVIQSDNTALSRLKRL